MVGVRGIGSGPAKTLGVPSYMPIRRLFPDFSLEPDRNLDLAHPRPGLCNILHLCNAHLCKSLHLPGLLPVSKNIPLFYVPGITKQLPLWHGLCLSMDIISTFKGRELAWKVIFALNVGGLPKAI